MNGFLLDTNIVSEVIRPKPEVKVVNWLDSTSEDLLFLSVLTLGEIRKGIAALRAGARRIKMQTWLETELRVRFSRRILPIDEAVADRWGYIAAAAADSGRPVPAIDGLLAATALQHNLTFVTRNSGHVIGTGVRVYNPWLDWR